jgi:hypothetical protein
MGHDELERPKPYFGDYPSGAYWSAISPEGSEELVVDDVEHYSYEGTGLRIMWDEAAGPLWGDEGLLGEDAQWMRRALGLSDALIDDLLTWKRDMTTLHYGRPPVHDWPEQKRRLDDRGGALAVRLNAEVGEKFRVWYHA